MNCFCPLEIISGSFCPLKIISVYLFQIILHCKYPESEKISNGLKESEIIYKGQKRFTKGFLKLTLLALLAKMRLFLVVFKHCVEGHFTDDDLGN